MMPRKLSRTWNHAPMPELKTIAERSSSASSEGARLQSRRSIPALSPIIE